MESHTISDPTATNLRGFSRAVSRLAKTYGSSSQFICAVSSVRSDLTALLLFVLKTTHDIDAVLVTSASAHKLEIRYSPPESLGSDRIADAAAAVHIYGAPCITVNFGTATTFNVLTQGEGGRHVFAGGVICAGLDMTKAAFESRLPNLGAIARVFPGKCMAQSTVDAIASGLLYGHAAMADGLVRRLQDEIGVQSCPVIATGGNGVLITAHCSAVTHIALDLTLRGIAIVVVGS